MELIQDPNPKFHRERAPAKALSEPLVMCGGCKGFLSKHFYSRHRSICMVESCPPTAIKMSSINHKTFLQDSEQSRKDILSTLPDDEVGNICRRDETILKIGSYLFDNGKRKLEKHAEVKRTVRSDMRRLGHLYIQFLKG